MTGPDPASERCMAAIKDLTITMKKLRVNPQGRCERCGSPISYHALFCLSCGRRNNAWVEPKEGECGNCHARLGKEDEYCRYCGTRAGEGAFEPYQNFLECVYGPMPVERIHTCSKCGYSWTTCVMIDRQRYCPKCGAEAPYTSVKEFEQQH